MGFNFKELIGLGNISEEPTEEEINKEKEKLKAEEEIKERPYKPFSIKAREENPVEEKVEQRKIGSTFTGTKDIGTLVVIEAKSFDECPKLVDGLKGRRPVIINLEKVETEVAKKIFDFLSGATYALNGNVKRISNNIFIFTPQGVNISQNSDRNFDITNAKSWKDR